MTPNEKSYEAMTIAKWFVAWAQSNDAEVSNLKLQKLLYYAQGHHLRIHGVPLFSDPIQAWSHGPVVVSVYHAFKSFGSNDVKLAEDDDFDWPLVDPDVTQLLIDIWQQYGGLAAWRLRDMTHDELPWKQHFAPNVRDTVIPLEALEKHFRRPAQMAS